VDTWLFYIFAVIAVGASLGVVGQRNPMHSVLLLIASFAALAGLYIQLDSPFAAVTQIIVYAGAIMVLFLFVVMLLNASHEDADPGVRAPVPPALKWGGVVLAAVFLGELVWVLASTTARAAEGGVAEDRVSSVSEIGRVLFTEHMFAFEVTSVLILAAMVGAVALAKRRI
jgi:NADH-quinone oxidoreductase subunit J